MIVESQVRALDNSIQALDEQITSSRSTRVNEPWREAWRGFTTRWQIQRDSWLGASSVIRKFGFNESTYESYRFQLLKWQKDFQKRIEGAAPSPPKVVPPETPWSLTSIFLGGNTTTLLLTALILGGVYYIYKQKGQKHG